MIILYIIGFFILQTLLLIWFDSPLKSTLGEILFRKLFLDNTSFDIHLGIYWGKLGVLSSCEICISFWLSLIIATITAYSMEFTLLYLISAWLTYPILSFIFRKYFIKKH